MSLNFKARNLTRRGTRADQPAAADVAEGTLYFVTDELVIERSTGSAWEDMSTGGSTSPGGADTQVQFNDGGAFGGDAGLTYNKTTDALTLAGLLDLSGAAAGQVKFPASQNASSDANTLDDYEEGSWTPTITGSGGGSGQVYAVQSGFYIKIGRFVYASGRIVLSTLGTVTTGAQVGGLPFTVTNTGGGVFGSHAGAWKDTTSSFVTVQFQPVVNDTKANIVGPTGASTNCIVQLVQADLANNTEFRFAIMYLASA